MTALRIWWAARSLREKRLIAIMLALAAIIIAWLGILRPITAGLAGAQAAHRTAIDRAARVEAGAALLRRAPAPPPAPEGPLDQFVAQRAAEAGFALDDNTPAGADSVSIAIGTARAPALLAWLGDLETGGLIVDAVAIQPGPDRTVSARLTLRRPER